MLDQSFSYENFRILLDVENRKGKYLQDKGHFDNEDDYFCNARKLTAIIIRINKILRFKESNLTTPQHRNEIDFIVINKLKDLKENIKELREEELKRVLKIISNKVNNADFNLNIEKGCIKFGSQLYVNENTVENYLVLKQLQRNIYKTFGVKQSNRKVIISQIGLLLNDNFPKIILRTDISKFYESIPHKQLISKIEENSLLTFQSKQIIKKILNQYWNILLADGVKTLDDERVGIPRGIAISAILSELYLKDFDNSIRSLKNVVYYARYVDDIMIIFSPENRKEPKIGNHYKRQIEKIINQFNLQMNKEKTTFFDLKKSNSERCASVKYEITFLGYKFIKHFKKEIDQFGNKLVKPQKLIVRMSDQKRNRYQNKVLEVFVEFERDNLKYVGRENQINRRLIQRIKILTNNFRLYRRKSNVLIGIYFSNEFLTNTYDDLKELDIILQQEIIKVKHNLKDNTLKRLEGLSFLGGFKTKNTLNFNFNNSNKRGIVNINKILKVWENL